MRRALKLYHYTCGDHGLPGIVRSGQIRPNRHLLMPRLGPVIWLTSDGMIDDPERAGLTRELLSCDRTQHRFVVRTHAARPWSDVRHLVDAEVLADLEAYGAPQSWFVVRRPLTRSEYLYDGSGASASSALDS